MLYIYICKKNIHCNYTLKLYYSGTSQLVFIVAIRGISIRFLTSVRVHTLLL